MPAMTPTAAALAPNDPRNGPIIPRAPSYVKSAKKLTIPMVRTNRNAARLAISRQTTRRPTTRQQDRSMVSSQWSRGLSFPALITEFMFRSGKISDVGECTGPIHVTAQFSLIAFVDVNSALAEHRSRGGVLHNRARRSVIITLVIFRRQQIDPRWKMQRRHRDRLCELQMARLLALGWRRIMPASAARQKTENYSRHHTADAYCMANLNVPH